MHVCARCPPQPPTWQMLNLWRSATELPSDGTTPASPLHGGGGGKVKGSCIPGLCLPPPCREGVPGTAHSLVFSYIHSLAWVQVHSLACIQVQDGELHGVEQLHVDADAISAAERGADGSR